MKGQKARLENKRQKLLEAHYNNAIPLDLLKSEQQKITKELAMIEYEIRMHDTTFEEISENLRLALDMMEDCGKAYRSANNATKRLMNQAIFKKFYVSNMAGERTDVMVEFKAPFDQIVEPIKNDLSTINRATRARSSKLEQLMKIAKDHIQAIFGCDLSVVDKSTCIEIASKKSNFFGQIFSSNNFLVDPKGIEPSALRMRTVRSPS